MLPKVTRILKLLKRVYNHLRMKKLKKHFLLKKKCLLTQAKHCALFQIACKKKTPWPESANELCRPSDRRLSAKLVPNFRIEGATWSAWRIPTAVFSAF
jgi:hypothetical protein